VSPRVVFVADSDAWGGAEVYLTHLVRRAARHGWMASLVCAEPVADRFSAFLRPGQLTTVPLARHRATAPAIGSAIAARRPDVVAVNLVDPASNAAALAVALAVAPTVGVLHLAGDSGDCRRRRELGALYRRLAGVLTPSAAGRRQVLADFGVARDRVHVVPNGVDVPAFPSGPAGRTVPRVGALGRLTEQKGFDVLVEAVRRLVADGTRLEVVIGGAGRDDARLRAAAAGLPVTFPGFVTDVRGFLAGLDVFCLPSRREALPLVLLEAMAEGLPCVATDVGDVAAAVGADAVLVPPSDVAALAAALCGVLAGPDRRAGLGARARRRAVAGMDADVMAERTFGFLEHVRGASRARH
jgi:glycosyltransferase involved in cell wall biosynthesis